MKKQTEKEKKEKRREYARTHREQIALKQRLWNLSNPEKAATHRKKSYNLHIEQRKTHGKKYYNENREKVIARQKKYYERNKEAVKLYQSKLRRLHPEKALFNHAKLRAKQRGILFNITIDDILVPDTCPFLEIPILVGDSRISDGSPTLDRIINSEGYTKNNIQVISYKANRMKNNSNFDEFQTMYKNWSKINKKGECNV